MDASRLGRRDIVWEFVDERGSGIDLASVGDQRAVTRLESRGRPLAAFIHDPSLLVDRRLIDATGAAARLALDTITEVDACPATRAALRDGRVSMAQAREIATTEQVAPGHEADLVELASGASLRRVAGAPLDRTRPGRRPGRPAGIP